MRLAFLVAACCFFLPLSADAGKKYERHVVGDHIVECNFSREEVPVGDEQELAVHITEFATQKNAAGLDVSLTVESENGVQFASRQLQTNANGNVKLRFRIVEGGEHTVSIVLTDLDGNKQTGVFTFAGLGEKRVQGSGVADSLEIMTLTLLSIATIVFLFSVLYTSRKGE